MDCPNKHEIFFLLEFHFVCSMNSMAKRIYPSSPSGQPANGTPFGTAQINATRLTGSERLRTPRPINRADGKTSEALFRVELALSRLENGDYGYCVTCDQPIAIAELEQDPARVVCNACRKPSA